MKFLITIDTEGDNLWVRPSEIKTANSRFLYDFQNLCDRYSFPVSYFVNYEMACCSEFLDFFNHSLHDDNSEIGTHIHFWNSPPVSKLTKNDYFYHPFATDYPSHIIHEKLAYMTELISENFGVMPKSHRAGRWALNQTYIDSLIEFGYEVDCSVTPLVNWSKTKGSPSGSGGSNYENFNPHKAFVFKHSTKNKMLKQLPMTIDYIGFDHFLSKNAIKAFLSNIKNRSPFFFKKKVWLRPNGKNLDDMLNLVDSCVDKGVDYLEFMLHSSELMPGGSPTFMDDSDIEKLYKDLNLLFQHISKYASGSTVSNYAYQLEQSKLKLEKLT